MKNLLLVLTLAVLVSGCSPCSNSNKTSLLFFSKQSFGVDFSTPTADDPALNLTLGYKSFDAAYVPVSVEPTSKEHNVTLINSSHRNGRINSGETASSATAEMVEQELDIRIKELNLLKKSIDLLRIESGGSEKIATGSNKTLKAISDELEGLGGRRDALSVFSSFDSNSYFRSSSAGVGLGKIFATGVAAQNLGENYRTPYGICGGELIQALLNVTDNDQRKALGDALLKICPAQGVNKKN